MQQAPQKENTCAIIVTYHPDNDLPERLRRIAAQVDRVLIVDNASGEAVQTNMQALCEDAGMELNANTDNRGVATALNQGMRWAGERGYVFALTFDQDTEVFADLLARYARVYETFIHPEASARPLAALGANFLASADGPPVKQIKPGTVQGAVGSEWVEQVTLLTSGTLLPVDAWNRVGPFRDEFFIDYVDEEFCLRARSLGYQIAMVAAPLMRHSIGEQSRYSLLGKQGTTYNYSPLRHFYRTRNAAVVWREFLRREPRYVAASMKFNIKIAAKTCLFETHRWRKLRALCFGLLDGLRRRFDRPVAQFR